MAETKDSGLAALTGASVAGGDLLRIVDLSDTSMAASGTNKKLAIDDLFEALRLLYRMGPGQEAALMGRTGCLGSTLPRHQCTSVTLAALTTQRLFLTAVVLPKGLPCTNITFFSGTTGATTPTNYWFTIQDASRIKLAITADGTTGAWAASTAKTLAITGGPYIIPATALYYIGIMVKATTVPTLEGLAGLTSSTARSSAPVHAGLTADLSLSTPASCPGVAGAITLSASTPYAEIT